MRTYVKIICIILAVLMIAVPLLSCKGVSGGTGTATGTAATTTEKTPDVTDAPSGTENTEGSGNGTDAPEIPDEPLPEFEDHLISKWDFEGDNALSDKASGGESKEAVTLSGSATVFGGILSVYGAYGSYASIDASAGSDVYDLKNKTVVLKARISNDLTEGPKNNISGLLSKR